MPSLLDILKNCTIALAGEIPGVGGMLSVLMDTFWEDDEDIWSQIEQQVEALVDLKLEHDESTTAQSLLNSLQDAMRKYTRMSYDQNKTQKATQLAILVDKADTLWRLFSPGTPGTGSVDDKRMRVTYLLYLVALAPLHLAILKEKVQHGSELYDSSEGLSDWQEDLEKAANTYDSYFPNIFNEWQTWRADKITFDNHKMACIDHLGGREVNWEGEGDDQKFNATKQLWMSYETVKMGDILEPTLYLSNAALYDKIEKKVDPKLKDIMTVVSGPLNSSTAGLPKRFIDSYGHRAFYSYVNQLDKNRTDTTAPVTRVRSIKSDNGLEGIQLTYGSKGVGRWHGGKGTEKEFGKHQVQNAANVPSGEHIQEVGVWMHSGEFCGFRFYMGHNKLKGNDGTDFGTATGGKDGTHKQFYFPLKDSTSYQLESMQTHVDTSRHGIQTLWLVFKRVLNKPTTAGLKM